MAIAIPRNRFTNCGSRAREKCHATPDYKRTKSYEQAGCGHTLLSNTAIEIIRLASKGNPRMANHVIVNALRLAADKNINYLPDEIIKEAIEILK